MKKEFELPPAAFTNAINAARYEGILKDFSFIDWRKSSEFRIFMAGYNSAIEKVIAKAKLETNLGQSESKLFGEYPFEEKHD